MKLSSKVRQFFSELEFEISRDEFDRLYNAIGIAALIRLWREANDHCVLRLANSASDVAFHVRVVSRDFHVVKRRRVKPESLCTTLNDKGDAPGITLDANQRSLQLCFSLCGMTKYFSKVS